MKPAIEALVTNNPAWSVSGETLVGNWQFADFASLRTIVAQLCDLADELNHHPTVTYGYNTLQIESTTHDAGNTITEKDIDLAQRVSQLIGELV
jgi:4a-hydroxytetrahydrobiopterin dehydratase